MITTTELNFTDAINKPYICDDRKKNISTANVLILPMEKFRGQECVCFFPETVELKNFIEGKSPEIKVEYAIDADKYQSISLNSFEFRLGEILVKDIALPLFVDLLYDFLKENKKAKNDDKVESRIIIENKDSKNLMIDYDGNFSNLKKSILKDYYTYTSTGEVKKSVETGAFINELC